MMGADAGPKQGNQGSNQLVASPRLESLFYIPSQIAKVAIVAAVPMETKIKYETKIL